MNILETIVDILLDTTAVTNLVDTYIFKRFLQEKVNGTGKAAIVISERPGESPGAHNWWRPRIEVWIYADNTTVDGVVDEQDRDDRMMAIFEQVDKVLHFSDYEMRSWGTYRFLRSLRDAEPQFLPDESEERVLYISYTQTVVI